MGNELRTLDVVVNNHVIALLKEFKHENTVYFVITNLDNTAIFSTIKLNPMWSEIFENSLLPDPSVLGRVPYHIDISPKGREALFNSLIPQKEPRFTQ